VISFEIITLFPNFFLSPLKESILRKAQEKGLIRVRVHNLRDYTKDKHHVTDDYPYGGGAGMVLKPEPVVEALEETRDCRSNSQSILLTPRGECFSQNMAEQLTNYQQIIFVCGRYEGVDERIRTFVDREISIGDYILNGGESAALVIVETVSRLIHGVLGSHESISGESFTTGLLEYPQYTRPRSFRDYAVPDVLLSGNHEEIRCWRLREALKMTFLRRPDLFETKMLSDEEKKILNNIKQELSMLQDKKS